MFLILSPAVPSSDHGAPWPGSPPGKLEVVLDGENSSSVWNRSVEYDGPRRIGGNPSLPGERDRVDDILARENVSESVYLGARSPAVV